MLLCQNGGWDQHCYLVSVTNCLEGGPHRNFGLAETHIAANEPVHGPPAFQILYHVGYGPGLVFGFGEGKGGAKFFIEAGRRPEYVALAQFAGRRHRYELIGHIPYAVFEACFA